MASLNINERNFQKIKEYEKNGPKKSTTGKHSMKAISLIIGAGVGAAMGNVGIGIGGGIVVGSLLDSWKAKRSALADLSEEETAKGQAGE